MTPQKACNWKRSGHRCVGVLSGLILFVGCAAVRPGAERPPTWSEVLRTPISSVATSESMAQPPADRRGLMETTASSDASKPDPLPREPAPRASDPPANTMAESPASQTPSVPASVVNAQFASNTVASHLPQWPDSTVTLPGQQRPKHRAAGVVHASEADFDQQVLQADVPVLVDFYATWCGPCKKLAPTLEEVAAETPQARVIKVDIDSSPGLAARYGVRSVPSLLVFKGGQVVASQTGLASKARLKAILDL